jgi:putative membrane protein
LRLPTYPNCIPSGDDVATFSDEYVGRKRKAADWAADMQRRSTAMMTAATELLASNGDWGPGGWWPIFPLFWLLLWGVVIFALFRFRGGWARHRPMDSAESVLAERYARGEISDNEYRERLSVLKATGK